MKKEKWNNNWKYWEEKDAFALVWSIPENAKKVTLPHDAMIEKPAYAESRNGGNTGFRDGGNYTYVKILELDSEELNQKHILRFDGVYCHASVYVNEQFAGCEASGYSAFYVDMTPFLKVGSNEIRVQVRNAGMTNSRWYSGSGIYRDVWMLTSGAVHFEPDMLRISTRNADEEIAVVTAEAEVCNDEPYPHNMLMRTVIKDNDGNEVGYEQTVFYIKGGARKRIKQQIVIRHPKLWSDTDPYLYNCECSLWEEDKKIDTEISEFGIRTLSADAARGLQVNAKTVKLRGACIHHDNGIIGAVSYEDAAFRRIKLLKEAGFNAIRMSHHTAAPVLLDACDKLGMYVMDEFTDMWHRAKNDLDYSMDFDRWWKTDAGLMVRKDYNHPSVVLYSIGNEIPEIGTDMGSDLCAQIAEYFKTLDPGRFTTAGINGVFAAGDSIGKILADLAEADDGGNVNDFMTVMDTKMDQIVVHEEISKKLEKACASLDVAGYNYMAARYEPDSEKYPNRVMVGSETCPPDIFRNWKLVRKLSSVIGDFTWTGWDYIGEAGVGVPAYKFGEGGFEAGFPCQLAYCADIDLTGFRRPLSYYREIVFGLRNRPFISVRDPRHYDEFLIKTPWVMSDSVSSWDWPGMEGKPVIVEVYSDACEAELFLNGSSLGRKRPEECIALFETVYVPGELRVIAYNKDGSTQEYSIRTAGKAVPVIRENMKGRELLYLDITLEDKDGNVAAGHDMLLYAEVKGAELLGFGSGDPKPDFNYNEGRTYTWNGRAQMILKLTGEKETEIIVRCEDGRSDTFMVE